MTVEAVLKQYETALNANDMDTILNLYGSNPAFIPQYSQALIGREAVRAGYEQVFATIKLSVRFDIHEVQQADDWAWARTSSAGHTRILTTGAEIRDRGGQQRVIHLSSRGQCLEDSPLPVCNQSASAVRIAESTLTALPPGSPS